MTNDIAQIGALLAGGVPANLPGSGASPKAKPEKPAPQHQAGQAFLGMDLEDPLIRNAVIKAGLQMMQPKHPNQSSVGHIAQAALGGMQQYEAAKAAQGETALEAKKVGAQANRDNAAAERDRAMAAKEQKLTLGEDELNKAKAEYYHAQATAEGKSSGSAEVDSTRTLAQALMDTRPDKYKTLQEAYIDAFKLRKASTNNSREGLMASLVEFAPVFGWSGEDVMGMITQYEEAGVKLPSYAVDTDVPPLPQSEADMKVGGTYKLPDGKLVKYLGNGKAEIVGQ